MITGNPTTPFYSMEKAKEFRPGIPPEDPAVEIRGLNEAIAATKRRIEEYKLKNWDASVFKSHLESLYRRLERAEYRQREKDRRSK